MVYVHSQTRWMTCYILCNAHVYFTSDDNLRGMAARPFELTIKDKLIGIITHLRFCIFIKGRQTFDNSFSKNKFGTQHRTIVNSRWRCGRGRRRHYKTTFAADHINNFREILFVTTSYTHELHPLWNQATRKNLWFLAQQQQL